MDSIKIADRIADDDLDSRAKNKDFMKVMFESLKHGKMAFAMLLMSINQDSEFRGLSKADKDWLLAINLAMLTQSVLISFRDDAEQYVKDTPARNLLAAVFASLKAMQSLYRDDTLRDVPDDANNQDEE